MKLCCGDTTQNNDLTYSFSTKLEVYHVKNVSEKEF
jgi:hypothetical protein